MSHNRLSFRFTKPTAWRFVARFAAAVILLFGTGLIVMSLKLRSVLGKLDRVAYEGMIESLRQRPATQKGYDIAISMASSFLETQADLSRVVIGFLDAFLLSGVGVIVSVCVYAYAAWQLQRLARASPSEAAQPGATDKAAR